MESPENGFYLLGVNKTLVRKLAFLAKSHEYFGLVEGTEHPSQLKYPFCEVRKGSGTDIEFVVNVHMGSRQLITLWYAKHPALRRKQLVEN